LWCPTGAGARRATEPGSLAFPSIPTCTGGTNPVGTSCTTSGAECQISSWMGAPCLIKTALYTCEGSIQNQTGAVTTTREQVDAVACAAAKTPTTCNVNKGATCNSSPNSCGMTAAGTIQCDGTCNVVAPSNASCPIPAVSGQCAASLNGKELPIKPSTGLCDKGRASAVTGSGSKTDPWSWTCTVGRVATTVQSNTKPSLQSMQLAQVVSAPGKSGGAECFDGDRVKNVDCSLNDSIGTGEDSGGGVWETIINIIITPIVTIITPIIDTIITPIIDTITPTVTPPIIVDPIRPTPGDDAIEVCTATKSNAIDDLPAMPVIGGTSEIEVGLTTGNTIVATDPEGDSLYYEIDWNWTSGVPRADGTTGSSASGIISPIGHIYNTVGVYTVKGRAIEVYGLKQKSAWATYTIKVIAKNVPVDDIPTIPVIGGTTIIEVDTPTANTIVATDPEGDQLYYEIDWNGNGSVDGTTGASASGAISQIGHIYNTVGTYTVKGRAIEVNGLKQKSAWATYTVRVVPRNTLCTETNACGVPHSKDASGVCIATPLPNRYSESCTTANSCGMTNTGTITCSGACSAAAPSNSECSGPCISAANNCGDTATGTRINGVCNAVTPVDRSCPGSDPTTITDFRASPKLISLGKSSKLFWQVVGPAGSCTITYTTVTNSTPVSVLPALPSAEGSKDTGPVTEKRLYLLKCGDKTATTEVNVFSLTEI
jgi:hypothetical protein